MFRSLTEMSFEQVDLRDRDLMRYVADLLVEFVHIDNLYRLRDEQGRRLEHLVLIDASGDRDALQAAGNKFIAGTLALDGPSLETFESLDLETVVAM